MNYTLADGLSAVGPSGDPYTSRFFLPWFAIKNVNGAFIFQQNMIIFLQLNTSWLDLSIFIKLKLNIRKKCS